MKKLKKALIIMLVVLVGTLGMTACGGGGDDESTGELNIYMWSDYMAESIIQDFEKETGVKVNVSYMNSTEEAVAKISSGGGKEYDLAMPSDADMQSLIDGGHLEKINTADMENYQYIGAEYKDRPFDPNNEYAVPYLMNYVYVVVNKDTCPVTIDEYEDLLDPQLEGKLASVTGVRNMFALGLVATGGDPNSTDDKEIEKAYEWLQKYFKNVSYLNSDDAENALVNGSCVAAYIFDGMAARAFQQAEEGQHFEVVPLKDPVQLGIDEFVIPAGAKNKANAEKFLDYLCNPEVMAKNLTDGNPYLCPNPSAVELMDDDYKNNPALDIPESLKTNFFLQLDIGDAVKTYDKYWTMLMAE